MQVPPRDDLAADQIRPDGSTSFGLPSSDFLSSASGFFPERQENPPWYSSFSSWPFQSDSYAPISNSYGAGLPFSIEQQFPRPFGSAAQAPVSAAAISTSNDAAPMPMAVDPNVIRVGGDITANPSNGEQKSSDSPAVQKPDDSSGLEQAQLQDGQAQISGAERGGVAVVLPDGSTLPNEDSPTGTVLSPVPDLSDVAAAGRKAGFIHRSMLLNPLTAIGAPAFMVWALRDNLHQGGNFDYQRQGGQFLRQYTPVSNVNVGLFAQQAGLTLEETLAIAGLYARLHSRNARPDLPYGLNEYQRKFTTMGYQIGERRLFGKPAIP